MTLGKHFSLTITKELLAKAYIEPGIRLLDIDLYQFPVTNVALPLFTGIFANYSNLIFL